MSVNTTKPEESVGETALHTHGGVKYRQQKIITPISVLFKKSNITNHPLVEYIHMRAFLSTAFSIFTMFSSAILMHPIVKG